MESLIILPILSLFYSIDMDGMIAKTKWEGPCEAVPLTTTCGCCGNEFGDLHCNVPLKGEELLSWGAQGGGGGASSARCSGTMKPGPGDQTGRGSSNPGCVQELLFSFCWAAASLHPAHTHTQNYYFFSIKDEGIKWDIISDFYIHF